MTTRVGLVLKDILISAPVPKKNLVGPAHHTDEHAPHKAKWIRHCDDTEMIAEGIVGRKHLSRRRGVCRTAARSPWSGCLQCNFSAG